MTQEELKNELIKAAENGKQKYFNEICEQLEQTIENRMLMLDRFDGVILSTKMDEFTKEKFLDNYKSLANYFYNIKTRSHDYLNYLENNLI